MYGESNTEGSQTNAGLSEFRPHCPNLFAAPASAAPVCALVRALAVTSKRDANNIVRQSTGTPAKRLLAFIRSLTPEIFVQTYWVATANIESPWLTCSSAQEPLGEARGDLL